MEFKQRGKGAVCQSFHYHLAWLIEMLHAIERIEELAADPDLLREHVRAKAGQNRNQGVGSCEAPRGTLFHDYQVDDDGLIRKVNLLVATGQNNLAMNRAVEQTARQFVSARALQEGKPEKMVDKIIEGRLAKFYEEICLYEQPFIRENSTTVGDLIKATIAKVGENISVSRFVRFKVGEAALIEETAEQTPPQS